MGATGGQELIDKQKNKLIKKYSDYYQTENQNEKYELVGIDNYFYPYYRINLKCVYKEKSSISIAEEYFLRAIQAGVKNITDLQEFLGLDDPVFEDIYAELHQKDFCNKNPELHLTPSGIEFLKEMGKENYIREQKKIYIDGVTGEPQCEDVNSRKYKEQLERIKPAIPYPRSENLAFFYRSLFSLLKKDAQEIADENNGQLSLHEITEIVDSAFKINQKITILFYQNNKNDDWRILALSDGDENLKITRNIMEKEEVGKSIINFPRQKSTSIDEVETRVKPNSLIKLNHISDVEKLKDEDFITMPSHRILLEKALKESSSEVIINTPWIRDEVFTNTFKNMFEKALEREVAISIIFGMGDGKYQRKPDIDSSVKKYFDNLRLKFGNFLNIKTTRGNHGKVLICDNSFMVTTSFNWLSFKGDPKRKLRREFGSFSRNIELIAKTKIHLKELS